MDKKVAFYTLGCKVNSYDTESMRELFLQHGYTEVDFSEKADIYIINTCTVTNIGDRKSRQVLRRAKRLNPESLVIATGCYAQTSPEAISEIEEVDLIVGNKDRKNIVEIAENTTIPKITVSQYDTIEAFDEIPINQTEGHTRAYIKVQEGCRQYCSYCIVPYARGPLRSRDLADALSEIERLADNDYKEIVLTGIHIASYGLDRNEKDALIHLIEEAAKQSKIERIRLSSLEPRIISEDFLKRLKEIEQFCDHFHLSLQSGSKSVLERMNRKYTPVEYLDKVKLIRSYFPNAAITTDIIVGFPGETEKEFQETLDFVKEVGFSQIHIFPYSKRSGTPAADYPDQIDGNVKNERVKVLTALENELRNDFIQKNDGIIHEVLFEREIEPNIYSGHTKNYIPVRTSSDEDLTGQIRKVILNSNKRENAEII